jgi:hypothetical protein
MKLWMDRKFRGQQLVISLPAATHIDIVHVADSIEHAECEGTVHQVPETVD